MKSAASSASSANDTSPGQLSVTPRFSWWKSSRPGSCW